MPVPPRHDIELQDVPPGRRRTTEYDSLPLRELFNRYDRNGDNQITHAELRQLLTDGRASFSSNTVDRLIAIADQDNDKQLNFNEFERLVKSGALPEGVVQRLMNSYVRAIVPPRPPSTEAIDGEYEDKYTCCPPPIALIILAVIEVIAFAVDVIITGSAYSVSGPVATVCIYDPHRRYQAWRFLSYVLVHIGEMHITVNLAVLLVLGIPLEMVHGWWRVLTIFFTGAVFGSLLTSVTDPTVYLAGASGGVYAIITAHLATIIMNWSEMAFPAIQLIVFSLLMGADFGTAIYQRYVAKIDTQVGYMAHLGGAIAGLLVGIYILRNFNLKKWERWLWWVALGTYVVCMLVFIIWNVAFPDYFPTQYYDK